MTHNLGLCADCDADRILDANGRCEKCGSNATMKRGAIKELENLMEDREGQVETWEHVDG